MAQTSSSAEISAITEEDRKLFDAAGAALSKVERERTQANCPQMSIPGGVVFPLAEPRYNAKRRLQLDPFILALEGLTPQRAAALDTLLAGKTLPDMQALLNGGGFDSVELVTYYIDRIRRYDVDRFNSVLELNPEVLRIAAELDAERAAGIIRGPLHGIPVLIKDNIATGDQMHTTAGAYALRDWRADRDAFLVRKLRDGGAIILGKTNLSEWANFMDPCMPNGFSVIGGQTRSPYGPLDPSGSSSGSAVAVAANFTVVSVGSETSGSLIWPARFNSMVSLRPSLGLISRDYIVPLAADLDTPGPMGRSVTDVAILLNAMAGVDQRDAKTLDAAALEGTDFTQFLSLEQARKLRAGVLVPTNQAAASLQEKLQLIEQVSGSKLSPEEQARLLAEEVLPELGGDPKLAIAALKTLGIEVVEIEDSTLPPPADTAQPLLLYGFRAGVAQFFDGLPAKAPITGLADVVLINNEDPTNRAPYGQTFLEAAVNNSMDAAEYDRVRAVAQALARHWIKTALQANDVDVLVAGTAYTGNGGAAGIPALTIPAGLDPAGRPQGIVLAGDYLAEPYLFALGYALEQSLQGRVEPDLDTAIKHIDALGAQ